MKRAIFDLIKKAKLWGGRGRRGDENAMMNDKLNVCSPRVCLFFISFKPHDGLCFIVPLMLFSINQKSYGELLMSVASESLSHAKQLDVFEEFEMTLAWHESRDH